jgi:phage-related protein (TIGR01555 family)
MKTLKQLVKQVSGSFRSDNWRNASTGLGASRGRVSNTQVRQLPQLSVMELSELYRSNGLAKRIVNSFVDDALRNGFLVCNNTTLKEELKRLSLIKTIKEACYFSRLYGGSMLVVMLDDGLDFKEPVSTDRIQKIVSFKMFDKSQISWQESDINKDFLSPYFALPEFYTITPNNWSDVGRLKIHASRCKILDGIVTDITGRRYNGGWGDSVLQACFDALRRYGIVAETSTEIITDFVQVILKINGLADKMVKEGGRQQIAARGAAIDESRSVANLIFLDSTGEDYEKKSSSVAGLAELWDRFSESICAVTGYPATRLFGKSPAGLNSTGTGDLKNYYDLVSAYRSDEVEPIIDWVTTFITSQKSWKGDVNIEWTFASLVEQSPLEDAELKKLYAEIDCMYIDRGAIDAGDTWQARFGSGTFKENIELSKLEQEDLSDIEELELLTSIQKESAVESKAQQVVNDIYQSIS